MKKIFVKRCFDLKRAVAFTVAVALLAAVFALKSGVFTGNAAENAEKEAALISEFGECEILSSMRKVSAYGAKNMKILSAEEAAKEGVPEGYEGYVLAANRSSNVGYTFDFTGAGIAVNALKSISFRIFVEPTDDDAESKPEIRIPLPGNTSVYLMRYEVTKRVGNWMTCTVYASGIGVTDEGRDLRRNGNELYALADENGLLGAFEVAVRRHSGSGAFYIDSLKLNLRSDIGDAPEIIYDGPDSVSIPKGSRVELDAKAYDEAEKTYFPVEYVWEDGVALEEDGIPAEGTTCRLTMRAHDSRKNVAEKTVTVTVVAKDTVPPEINVKTDNVYCPAGAVPSTDFTATDEFGKAEVSFEWEDGALDSFGRLNEGDFRLELSAVDLSGNISRKTVYFHAGKCDFPEITNDN
ncbi:MAG: hypothetical protein J6T65_01470 [Clostridia bacterium]|nr:hypothetical protein [Clostridia bacterium]